MRGRTAYVLYFPYGRTPYSLLPVDVEDVRRSSDLREVHNHLKKVKNSLVIKFEGV